MQDTLKLQQKLVPELIEVLEKRYTILRTIYYNQPIGRRILANNMNIGERIIRNEINFLKEQNLIEVNVSGMYVTLEGEEIIDKLKGLIHDIKGLSGSEKFLKEYLKLKDVLIVPGDVDIDKTVIKEVGKVAATYIKHLIKDENTIALTGGTTVKEVVDNFPKMSSCNDVLILPARGGMAKNVDIQANTLVARLADKIQANYEMLHAPDNLSNNALETMLNEKGIKDIVTKIQSADILIYGIGIATDMAKKRSLTEEQLIELDNLHAVGEAFGHYFNENGEVVFSTPTIGVKNEDIGNIKNLVAVAAGKSKARAILATGINKCNGVLITDEGAAEEIINIIQKKE